MAGLFITLEGGDGSGKTTAAIRLTKQLEKEGYTVTYTREPGGVKIAEEIRSVIVDVNNKEMDAKTEALLYAADLPTAQLLCLHRSFLSRLILSLCVPTFQNTAVQESPPAVHRLRPSASP